MLIWMNLIHLACILQQRRINNMSEKPAKATSLTELGYKIVPATGKDSKGNEISFKITGPAPVFFVKTSKRGRIFATKEKDSISESTIDGLFDFKVLEGDLVGRRLGSQAKPPTSVTNDEAVVAA